MIADSCGTLYINTHTSIRTVSDKTVRENTHYLWTQRLKIGRNYSPYCNDTREAIYTCREKERGALTIDVTVSLAELLVWYVLIYTATILTTVVFAGDNVLCVYSPHFFKGKSNIRHSNSNICMYEHVGCKLTTLKILGCK